MLLIYMSLVRCSWEGDAELPESKVGEEGKMDAGEGQGGG